MNNETKASLICAAKMRQVLTDVVEQLEMVDIDEVELAGSKNVPPAVSVINKVKLLLKTEGMYERIYPLEPLEGETFTVACRRIFGPWVTREVLARRDLPLGGGGGDV